MEGRVPEEFQGIVEEIRKVADRMHMSDKEVAKRVNEYYLLFGENTLGSVTRISEDGKDTISEDLLQKLVQTDATKGIPWLVTMQRDLACKLANQIKQES